MTKRGTTANINKQGQFTRENKKKKVDLLLKARQAKKQRACDVEKAFYKLELECTSKCGPNCLIKKHFSMPKPIYREEISEMDALSTVPLVQNQHTCLFFTDKQELSAPVDNINNKTSQIHIQYWANQTNMSFQDYKMLRAKVQKKTRKLKKRVDRVLNYKRKLKTTYIFRKNFYKSELQVVKLFKTRTRGWQKIDYRREEDIQDNLDNLDQDILSIPYRKQGVYKKKERNLQTPTNIKLYYRKQRKNYFMQHLGRVIPDDIYQKLHLQFRRHLPIDEVYEEALIASFSAVNKRKTLEIDGNGKRTKVKRQSAAVMDRIFDRRIYLPHWKE